MCIPATFFCETPVDADWHPPAFQPHFGSAVHLLHVGLENFPRRLLLTSFPHRLLFSSLYRLLLFISDLFGNPLVRLFGRCKLCIYSSFVSRHVLMPLQVHYRLLLFISGLFGNPFVRLFGRCKLCIYSSSVSRRVLMPLQVLYCAVIVAITANVTKYFCCFSSFPPSSAAANWGSNFRLASSVAAIVEHLTANAIQNVCPRNAAHRRDPFVQKSFRGQSRPMQALHIFVWPLSLLQLLTT